MLSVVVLIVALAAFGEARPRGVTDVGAPKAGFNFEPFIVGGTDAVRNEFPWQLSQQRQSLSTGLYSHSCGASLLTSRYALSAAHCVDGAATSILRVIAGLYDRTQLTEGVGSNIVSYTMHSKYNTGAPSYANDIAILKLASAIEANGVSIVYATLPADNSNQYAGQTCTISGWGRTSADNTLPLILQKADIGIITTAECASLMAPVQGTSIWDGHICLYDSAQQIGSCNGDSGGPLNCEGGTIVAGITSWGISSNDVCLQSYPSVYTRVSYYLDWIVTNTPTP